MKILLADDSALIRTSISKTLVEKGFEIILCNDGAEALQKIIEHKDVWVAILDWQMPKITGPEVCRAIRGTKIGRYVYSVLLSSHDDSDRVVQGMEAGADDYILKSASAEEFCLRVKAGVRVAS
ncbi:MAG: response regulator transcription factor, partial [Bdellovibrionales bacterium]|nr:response regulator transcription factor [Bdellovibrionales bacterium]